VFDRYFPIIYDFVKNKKSPVSGIIVMITIAAIAGLGLLTFESSIEIMLPDEDNIHQTIGFLRNSALSDKIVISLSLASDDKEKSDLFRAADQLEASLTLPLFTRTVSGASGTEIMNEVLYSHYFPYIATEEDLLSIEGMITSEYVSGRMQEIYRQLLRPQSIFTASMFYADPLGINLLLLHKLKRQAASMGYKVGVENGHFISPDGRHTMIIAHTSVPITDSAGSGKLMEVLREKLGELPSYVSADIVSGHLHTVSNERVIKKDIRLTIGIAAIAFLLLFFILFRDIKAVLVFLIPLASVVLSMNLSSFIMGSLSYWVVGLGTVIAGIDPSPVMGGYRIHASREIMRAVGDGDPSPLGQLGSEHPVPHAGPGDDPGRDAAGDGGLHEPGAGAGQTGGQARRRLGVRLRPLRVPDGAADLRRRDGHRHPGRHPAQGARLESPAPVASRIRPPSSASLSSARPAPAPARHRRRAHHPPGGGDRAHRGAHARPGGRRTPGPGDLVVRPGCHRPGGGELPGRESMGAGSCNDADGRRGGPIHVAPHPGAGGRRAGRRGGLPVLRPAGDDLTRRA